MADGFSVNSESLRRSAQNLRSATDELLSHLDTFTAVLNEVGDPWGFDTLGMLIGGGYAAAERLGLETFDSIVDSLDDYADRLDMMADSYDSADADSTDRFGSMGEET
jgi:uncharacterized protein YukE